MLQVRSSSESHQVTAIRLIAESLYEATRDTTALTNQVQNELALLLAVLDATETHSSLFGTDSPHLSVLKKRLQSCHLVLVDLQKLQLHPDSLGAQSQINEIRGSLSSLVFGLSEVNTNMMISSHRDIQKALKSLLDNIGSGSHEPSVVSDILSNDQSKVEADQAWAQLQQDLDAAGVSPEMSTQNHDFILLTLRNMVENGNTISKKPLAVLKDVPDPAFGAQHSDRKTSLNDTDDWLANGSKDLPFLPPTPRNDSLLNDPSAQLYHGHSQKPSAAEETLPISVAFDIQDSAITRSQPLPHEDFPILVSTELPPEKGISQHSNQIIPTAPIALDTLKVTRNKKTNRMSRVIFQMTNSKQKLITPVQHGDLEAVKTLLEKGADANAINNEGHTPLMAAASYGHESIVRILIEHGAKLDNVASSRETALGAAAARGFERIVRMLIASGANIEAGSNKAKTALSEAASYGQDRIVTLLLDCGADINAINFTGQTALAAAALNGNMRVARVLLDRGADLDRMGYAGQSPLFKAIKQNYAEMVVLLMERGANPGVLAGFEKSETALSFAARMQRYHILGIFRRYGYEAGLIQYC